MDRIKEGEKNSNLKGIHKIYNNEMNKNKLHKIVLRTMYKEYNFGVMF